ncbi:hypothetical protein ACFLZ4_02110 [Patescibacteria group bacterium]
MDKKQEFTKDSFINATIKTKEETLFEGAVKTVSSINERGTFDVLPFHTNFITLIRDYVVFNSGTDNEQKFEMEKGVLYVMNNEVNVYVGI